MLLSEFKRHRLQTLARDVSGNNKVKVVFGENPQTDFKVIELRDFTATKEIVPRVPCTEPEAWVALKAATCHEAAHLRFTSFPVWEEACKDPRLANILNTLEDLRIERAISERFSGAGRWLLWTNKYVHKHLMTNINNQDPYIRFLLGLMSAVMFGQAPPVPEKNLILKYLKTAGKARKASTTEEALECAREILNDPEVQDLFPAVPPVPKMAGSRRPKKAPTLGQPKSASGNSNPQSSNDPEDTDAGESSQEESPREDSDAGSQEHDSSKESPETSPQNSSAGENTGKEREDPDGSDKAQENAGESEEPGDKQWEDKTNEEPSEEGFDGESSAESESGTEDGFDEPGDAGSSKFGNETDNEAGFDDFGSENSEEDSSEETHYNKQSSEHANPDGDSEDDFGTKHGNGLPGDFFEETFEGDFEEDENEEEAEEDKEETEEEVDPLEEAQQELKIFYDRAEDGAFDLETPPGMIVKTPSPVHWEKPDRRLYMNPKILGTSLAREFQKILEKNRIVRSSPSKKGSLNPSALYRTSFDPVVFRKKNVPDATDLAVYLLIDCSGSMGDIVQGGYKINIAVNAAAILTEALTRLGIPHAITGFSTAYKEVEPGTGKYAEVPCHLYAKTFNSSKFCSRILEQCDCNKDGFSVRQATKELLARHEKQKLLIVISDGLPSAYVTLPDERSSLYWMDPVKGLCIGSGVRDTAQAVREAEKQGVAVVGIHISPAIPEYLTIYKVMFSHFIHLETVSYLPNILGKVVKQALDRQG